MPAARAPERDHQLRATALAIVRDRRAKRAFEVVEQLLSRRLADDVVAHPLVAAVEWTQLLHPVGVVEEPHVDHPCGAVRNTLLETEGEAGYEHPLSRLQRLRQLAQLRDVDAVMRALVAAARLAIVGPDVHQHVANATCVGVLQHHGAIASQRQHAVRIVKWRQPARGLKTGVDEHANRFLEVGLSGPAHDDQSHGRNLRREIRCPGGPGARRGRAPERAHRQMRKRGAESATTQMGRMGAEDPSTASGRDSEVIEFPLGAEPSVLERQARRCLRPVPRGSPARNRSVAGGRACAWVRCPRPSPAAR